MPVRLEKLEENHHFETNFASFSNGKSHWQRMLEERTSRKSLICVRTNIQLRPNDALISLRSFGQTSYEVHGGDRLEGFQERVLLIHRRIRNDEQEVKND